MAVYVKTDRKSSWHFCIVIMMMLFQCCNALFIGSINETMGERCPNSRLERELRASTTNCSPVEFYHCLYNSDNQLVESCYEFKQVPAGYFPKFNSYGTGNPIDYDECPPNRYQAWPIKSYEIKECSSIKSECISEGQIQCDNGSSSADRTCKCDYKLGYAMNGRHCCSPLASSDCFCYKKCKQGQRLNADYNCIDVCLDGQNCSFKTAYSGTVNHEITTSGLPANHGDVAYPLGTKFLYITAALITIASFLGMLYGFYKNKYRGKRKYGMVIFFLFLIVLVCVIYIILDWESKLTPKCLQFGISFLAIVALIGCVSGILIIRFHDIPKRFYFFTEDYEIELYKMLQAAKDGNLEQLKILHEGKAVDIDDVDYDQRSALHLAACEGHLHVVEFLLNNHLCNPSAKDRALHTAQEEAIRHKPEENDDNFKSIIELLKKYESGASKKEKKLKETFRERKFREIIHATKNGLINELKRLKDNNTIMDLSNSYGRTALHVAVECGMVETVEYLIKECKVSPFVWWSGKRPIDCIPNTESDKTIKIRKILMTYMDSEEDPSPTQTLAVDLPDYTQVVQMLDAASRGNLRLIKQYRESVYDMTQSDYDGRTVLHVAVRDNQNHVVDFLLSNEKFRDDMMDKKDRWGQTPFIIAKEADGDMIYYTFLKHYKELVDTENDEYRTFQLLTAGANGDEETLEMLQYQKVDMNLRDYDGRTALHLAAAENKLGAVKFLLEKAKVRSSIPDRENRKPIDDEQVGEQIKELINEAENENEFDKIDEQVCILFMCGYGRYL